MSRLCVLPLRDVRPPLEFARSVAVCCNNRSADCTARFSIAQPRWRAEFAAMGKAEGGRSGWVIFAYSPRYKRLVNQWAADYTTTLAGGRPVLVLDMYEHAYHMDYGAAPARYVDIYMEAIRWDNAVKLYEQYGREAKKRRRL